MYILKARISVRDSILKFKLNWGLTREDTIHQSIKTKFNSESLPTSRESLVFLLGLILFLISGRPQRAPSLHRNTIFPV